MKKLRASLISYLYFFLMTSTLFIIFRLNQTKTDLHTQTLLLTEKSQLIISILFLIFLCSLGIKIVTLSDKFLCKHIKSILITASIVLLVVKSYLSYGAYFHTGWDVEAVRIVVESFCRDQPVAEWYNTYFSWFPNNLLTVWIYKNLAYFAIRNDISQWEYILVCFNNITSTYALYLVFKVTYSLTGSYKTSLLAYAYSVFFIGFSPWFLINYSDALGFLFPILTLRIYQVIKATKNSVYKITLSFFIGFISCVGFNIKPQTFIVFIAISLIELSEWFLSDTKWKSCKYGVVSICGIILFTMLNKNFITPSLPFEDNKNMTIGWQHFVMMGLNKETHGIYNPEDYIFTQKYETNEERNINDLKLAKDRIESYGFNGLVEHLSIKQLINYGDGSFHWGGEGHFWGDIPEWANNSCSSFVRNIIISDGTMYPLFLTILHLLWVTILIAGIFYFLTADNLSISDTSILIPPLSIIGLTMFELIFEARARYLFTYSPIYVIIGCIGIANLAKSLNQSRSKIKNIKCNQN